MVLEGVLEWVCEGVLEMCGEEREAGEVCGVAARGRATVRQLYGTVHGIQVRTMNRGYGVRTIGVMGYEQSGLWGTNNASG